MCVEGESVAIRPLTVAGAAQARCTPDWGATSLFPVELRHVNHTASTNSAAFYGALARNPTIAACMTSSPPKHPIDQITERVDLLLQRYAQLQRTNGLLSEQVYALTQERDSLKSRLSTARAKVDNLIERLPPAPEPAATPKDEP